MIPKSKSKTAKLRKSLFTPLAVLSLEAEHQKSRDIQRIKEAYIATPLYSIQGNLLKTSEALFLSEFLNKILKDTDEHSLVFDFLQDSILILEEIDRGMANFHLVFLLKLTRFLGFYPNLEEYRTGDYFDLLNGCFTQTQPLHRHYLPPHDAGIAILLGRINFRNMSKFKLSRQDRVYIINCLLDYYRIHFHDFQNLKSLDVLHEVL